MQTLKNVSQITLALEYYIKKSEGFWRHPKSKARTYLIKALECQAFLKDWQKVADISSRAVFELHSFCDRREFYYIWMTSLIELSDISGLKYLAKHIKDFYKDDEGAWALSEMTKHFITGFQNRDSHSLKSLSAKDTLTKELISYSLIYKKSLKDKKKGLSELKKVARLEESNYFRLRNFLRAFSDNDLTRQMSDLYNSMNKKFPFSPEPYIVSGLISAKKKNWQHASRLFSQLAMDNPKDESYKNLTHFFLMKSRQKKSHTTQSLVAS